MHIESLIQLALDAGLAIMDIYRLPEDHWQVEAKSDLSPLTLADRRSHEVIARGLAATPYPVVSEEGGLHEAAARRSYDTVWIVDPLDGTKEFIRKNGEFTVNIALVSKGRPTLGVIYAPALGLLYWGRTTDCPVEGEAGAFKAEVDPCTLRPGRPTPLPATQGEAGGPLRVVASRSHLSDETRAYIDSLERSFGPTVCLSKGSSLKICLVAEGEADVYPRLAPTMEWDTAAGQAVATAAGCSVVRADDGRPVTYNKENLHNPYFIVKGPRLG